ncbi:MAG: hybrid sensor histidine kinase/response regulator [Pseudanabaena frigida]|uniref:histidine kinase n=1 Tax=Pseudanabaena frigida TaxID=945775 RepID=A0A2W4W7B0_9CYAN|nr:MAG: hybrid sensor histidine kinase/response regulator [Pseudanabaena frigida]
MYSSIDTEVHDQAYQFFKQEAPDFLQIIETGLLSLRNDLSTGNIHSIMRAAHSIKGGSASLNFEGIKQIAHKLEDVFRALYRYEGEIDADIEGLLLQAYDCLRLPLLEQIQTGRYDEHTAIANAEPVFEVLNLYFGDLGEDIELPTAAELGVDIVQIVFDGDVQQGISRLQNVLANPEGIPVTGEIKAQVEVFNGIGELLNLPGFKAIAQATLEALNHNADNPILVGKVAVANFETARAKVLAGDRAQGGEPSQELIALTKSSNQANTSKANASQAQDSLSTANLTDELLELDFEDGDSWFKSLEQEIDDIKPSKFNLSDDDLSAIDLGILVEDSIFTENDKFDLFSVSISAEIDTENNDKFNLFGDISPETDTENTVEIPNPNDLEEFDIDVTDSNFDIFAGEPDSQGDLDNGTELDIFNNNIDSAFGLVEFEDEEDLLADIAQTLTQPQPEIILEPTLEVLPAISESAKNDPVSLAKKVSKVSEVLAAKTTIKAPENTTPYISETVRVDLPRLERLNNFSSELVTQENASILQNQQLQANIERLQKQFKGFGNLSKNLQIWLDKAQRSQVRSQDISTVSSNLSSIDPSSLSINLPTSANLLADFDPLQMDSYSRLHGIIQEALEEIAQMDEGMRDMTALMQQTQQTQRRKQQILKQVRYDLLWSRMLPLGDILSSLPRMVRELSNKYDKQVNLKLYGTGTLVDKSVLEKLYDPFVHLVRNAFDHGTESTQERLDRGKPVIASIEIRAYYRGNQTYIEIKDDGHGINLEKVKDKAIAVGLINREQADRITIEEIYQFLFTPSFSTAETVSEMSGRGMGLSTVQEQVRSLKGTIEIKSELGQGTTFTIKLPLTLSIAKLLIFSIQDRLLAIAVNTLLGIINVDVAEVQIIQGKEFVRLEDRLIPLYPTSIFVDGYPLPIKSLEVLSTESFTEEDQRTLLLLADGSDIFALPIDRVLNEQELAIKPFGKAIAPPPYFYGCTVLGDGTLVPVIDSVALRSLKQPPKPAIALQSSELSALSSTPTSIEFSKPQPPQRKTILIVDDSLTARQALYLTLGKFGYQVIQAGDGLEAIDQLSRSTEIQAVLCDVEMPNMNGFEFLTTCRKERRFAEIPIVMLTSRSGQKHRQVAKMLGASGYLTKPYLEQELIKTIQALIV